eukprot:1922010-Rhodomonas_salina.2
MLQIHDPTKTNRPLLAVTGAAIIEHFKSTPTFNESMAFVFCELRSCGFVCMLCRVHHSSLKPSTALIVGLRSAAVISMRTHHAKTIGNVYATVTLWCLSQLPEGQFPQDGGTYSRDPSTLDPNP